MDAPPPAPVGPESGPHRGTLAGWIALALALAPALGAIAWVPEFTTQDGPAHLYNARILNASLRPGSPLSRTFEVAWRPLPNWSGHLATMALVSALPPGVANRAITALTLVALAGSVMWLRRTVAGPEGAATAALLASLLALNVTWLLGFTSFLLGAALMPATLAVWWGGRDRFEALRALGLAILLVLGYFSHPISLGLTVVGLGVLAALTPGPRRTQRGAWTAASLAPLVPLGLAYRAMTRSGGAMEPAWQHLEGNPWSPRAWAAQFGWVDPISLAAKTFRPFGGAAWVGNGFVSPALWTLAAVGVLAASSFRGRSPGRRGWVVLAGLLLLGGVVGPDTLGVKHGHYLPQRVALLGLVALVPWLDLAPRRSTRLATAFLGFAWLVQSAFVWDYALDCRDRVGRFVVAGPAIGSGKRVGTLLVGIKGRFRSNPMLHADCLFGLEGDNVIWDNYETAHYYFPVKVRPGLGHPPAPAFEEVALLDGPGEGPERARRWGGLLAEHGGAIDVIVEWNPGDDRGLDPINGRGYDPTFVDGPVRVWTRRDGALTAKGAE